MEENEVTTTWFGHSMFLIKSKDLSIVTDPFDPSIGYSFPDISADIVLISHGHYDHNYLAKIKGGPEIVDREGTHEIKGISIEGFPSYHDAVGGSQRGKNLIMQWELEGMKLSHLGDLGEAVDEEKKRILSTTDILFIPIGGMVTIGAEEALRYLDEIKPKIAFPMHYKTPDLNISVEPIEKFTRNFSNCKEIGKSSISISKNDLPQATEVWILTYK